MLQVVLYTLGFANVPEFTDPYRGCRDVSYMKELFEADRAANTQCRHFQADAVRSINDFYSDAVPHGGTVITIHVCVLADLPKEQFRQ